MLADRGYDADWIQEFADEHGAWANISPKRNRKGPIALAPIFTGTQERIRDDIATKVAADVAYKNAKENTPHTARMAHDQALNNVMQALRKDDTDVYKQFVENETFKRFVSDIFTDRQMPHNKR